MKERPILFNAPMVRAVLDGIKKQTRRVWKLPKWAEWDLINDGEAKGNLIPKDPNFRGWYSVDEVACPYGQPGDRLRVKEAAWMWCERRPNGTTRTGRQKWLYVPMRSAPVYYCTDTPTKPTSIVVSPNTGNEWAWRKKIGRFLPAWASRILLEIVSVRVELLNDISETDAWEEGCLGYEDDATGGQSGYSEFAELWESINGAGSWDTNPWVWVVEFKQVNP